MQPQSKDPCQELHPLVSTLAASIRSSWQKLPELAPLCTADDLKAIHGELDGETLFIGNELYQCRGFRKIHLEIARLGNGLQILHCVWFPDPQYDLPIFGADIVAGPAGISAAIVDLSPTSGELPDPVFKGLEAIERPAFRQVRDLPGWGTIFSSKVCFIRPDGADEEALFNQVVTDYLEVLSDCASRANPESSTTVSTINRYEGQLNYCLQQKRNDKTRRVLEKAFDPEWADRYIELLLFDNPPTP